MNSKTNNTKSEFAKKAEERIKKENQYQQFNSQAPYYSDNIVKSLDELVDPLFSVENNIVVYKEALLDAMAENIDPALEIEEFWTQLANKNCQTVKIEKGHLNFYNNNQEKIDITEFTQPIVFEAESIYYKERMEERAELIKVAKQKLKELKQSLKK